MAAAAMAGRGLRAAATTTTGRAWDAAAAAAARAPKPPPSAGPKTPRLICTTTAAAATLKKRVTSGPERYTEAYIKKAVEEFNIGKRHLANMMGEDPETFTQEDIDKAIAYLFPSGLFDKRARPFMKHPDVVFPKQRAILWCEDGRPFHFLFYTGKQFYYALMHEAYGKLLRIQEEQDRLLAQGLTLEDKKPINLIGSRWLIKEELEEMLTDNLTDQDYSQCIQLLDKLAALPCSSIEEDYVMKFRKQVALQSVKEIIEPLEYDEQGVAFITAEGRRKTARATVTLRDNGSGKITINGEDYIQYFPVLQDREQLMFPFQFLDRLEKHDMVCTVSGGGRSVQAGAIRLASSKALCSFVTEQEVEFMRQAGLLTRDPRLRERKKPGQEGARRKFTWNKR